MHAWHSMQAREAGTQCMCVQAQEAGTQCMHGTQCKHRRQALNVCDVQAPELGSAWVLMRDVQSSLLATRCVCAGAAGVRQSSAPARWRQQSWQSSPTKPSTPPVEIIGESVRDHW